MDVIWSWASFMSGSVIAHVAELGLSSCLEAFLLLVSSLCSSRAEMHRLIRNFYRCWLTVLHQNRFQSHSNLRMSAYVHCQNLCWSDCCCHCGNWRNSSLSKNLNRWFDFLLSSAVMFLLVPLGNFSILEPTSNFHWGMSFAGVAFPIRT